MARKYRKDSDVDKLLGKLQDKSWRMQNLYKIVDEQGQAVRFKYNYGQQMFMDNLWYFNLILKARQLGFTTLIDLFILDEIIWNSNKEGVIIADSLDRAKDIFRRKIHFPFKTMLAEFPELTDILEKKAQSTTELELTNGSIVSVDVTARSGTMQYLHISEFGIICQKHPEKAEEIVAGALETVHPGQMIFIESTAEGRDDYFHDMVRIALKRQLNKEELTKLDYRLHFYPWWLDPRKTLASEIHITDELNTYFESIEAKCDIKLSPGQKAWYSKKLEALGPTLVRRQHPSTVDEPFEEDVKGAYFANEMAWLWSNGAITEVPVHPRVPVETWWDLGMDDYTAIWFVQRVGGAINVIDYVEDTDKGMGDILKDHIVNRQYNKLPVRYSRHIGPHDITQRHISSGQMTAWKVAEAQGVIFERLQRTSSKYDDIEAVRELLPMCRFDKERCALGISRLEKYRRKWNSRTRQFTREPLHDENSHGSDAFMTGAVAPDPQIQNQRPSFVTRQQGGGLRLAAYTV